VIHIANQVNTEEPLMSVNNFHEPIVVRDEDAAVLLITRLILLEPGTFQTHPNMGVGIVSRFRHGLDTDIKRLESEITTQISKYLPMFTTVQVSVEIDNDNKTLKIYVTSDQIHTIIPISTDTGKVLTDMKI
jgi:hypothetical protein